MSDAYVSQGLVTCGHARGERIAGRYDLIRPLEEGGVGVVWVAHHVDLDIQVALKVLRCEDADPGMAERLLREAQSAARLDHPAVVRVFDTGRTAAGDPFLVMELLDGEALARVLARERRLDPTAAVRTLLPIAGALRAMHEQEMIHRDVKPENIFLARDDAGRRRPKLIDFGLARVPASRITQRGAVMGTPAYMSPEQLRGEDPDALCDIWALSAVLYETITGARPNEGMGLYQILTAASSTQVRPMSDHGIDEPELSAIVERGLRPPAERWPSARELGRALATWLWSRGVTDDLSGVSLRAAWLSDDDMRRLPRSRIPTARFPLAPVEAWLQRVAVPVDEALDRAAALATLAELAEPGSTAPTTAAPAGPRRIWPRALVLPLFVAGVAGGFLATRGATSPQALEAPAVQPAPAMATPAASGAPEPSPEPAVSAAPSAAPSAAAPSAAPPRVAPPRTASPQRVVSPWVEPAREEPALPSVDLRNPYR